MAIIVGVDEAGYGPNFGPLVVAATAWHVEEPVTLARANQAGEARGEGEGRKAEEKNADKAACATRRAVAFPPTASSPTASPFPDLYKLLRKAVVRSPAQAARRIAIADSKVLYKAGCGVRQLERGVLASIAAIESPAVRGAVARGPADATTCVERVAQLLVATAADPQRGREELPCHGNDEQPLPLESVAQEICLLAAKLRQACEASGVTLVAIRARLVFPGEFNSLVDRFGTKGAALSHVTLALVRKVVDELPLADDLLPTFIALDKHGGRNRYAALLQHHFPESWIEPISESRHQSRYRWRHGEAPVEAVFRVRCEELLPTALASMTAKYHRELSMRAFNAFWNARLPELRPTAGYPGDAHRFKAEIESMQRELGFDDRLLWRNR